MYPKSLLGIIASYRIIHMESEIKKKYHCGLIKQRVHVGHHYDVTIPCIYIHLWQHFFTSATLSLAFIELNHATLHMVLANQKREILEIIKSFIDLVQYGGHEVMLVYITDLVQYGGHKVMLVAEDFGGQLQSSDQDLLTLRHVVLQVNDAGQPHQSLTQLPDRNKRHMDHDKL